MKYNVDRMFYCVQGGNDIYLVNSLLSIPQIDASSFTMTFFGQGFSQGVSPVKNKPNIRICTQVKGPGISHVT